jgi:hypothetical protein
MKASFHKLFRRTAVAALLAVASAALVPMTALAAQLDNDARSAIPNNVQQIIVIDYRAMQNSSAAMDLKARILPPQLKELEDALKHSNLNDNHDIDQLAFAAYRTSPDSEETKIVGIAQGQFSLQDIMATMKKNRVKPTLWHTNKLYPMGGSGMMVVFLNPTTMIFGSTSALKPALDARDGLAPNLLTNQAMLDQMGAVDTQPLWSILDQKGTQFMMRSLMGEAAQLADYDQVKKRMLASRYTMNFQNGVKFDLDVTTPDTFTAATVSSLLNAAAMYKKVSGSTVEKQAIDATSIDSSAGTLEVRFATSDSQFSSLLQSPLFQSVVKQ